MARFAFVSRHVPTADQLRLAAEKSIDLLHVGDRDAFSDSLDLDRVVEGVVVVHPAAALRFLARGYTVGVFENTDRAAVGEKPRFETVRLHLFTVQPENPSMPVSGILWQGEERVGDFHR